MLEKADETPTFELGLILKRSLMFPLNTLRKRRKREDKNSMMNSGVVDRGPT